MKKNKLISAVLLLPVLLVVTLGGILLRLLQFGTVFNYETGFYTEWHFSIPALDILLIAGVILLGAIIFFLRKEPLSEVLPGNRVLSALCTLGLWGSLILRLIQDDGLSALSLLAVFFTALTSFGFLLLAFRRKPFPPKSGAFLAFRSIFPALWGCLQMVTLFFEESTLSNTSEYVFSILFLGCATVFFVKFGAFAFSEEETKPGFILLFSGVLTALFGSVFSLSGLISCLLGIMPWTNFPSLSCTALPFALLGFAFAAKNAALLKK